MNDSTLFDEAEYDLRKKFYDDCVAALEDDYELIYIDYRDSLSDGQVNALVARDWESLDESIREWDWHVRYDSADCISKEVADQIEAQGALTHGPDIGREVRNEFELSDWWDELRFEIYDRDRSNPIRDLARNTGRVLMRQVLSADPRLRTGDTTELVDELLADLRIEGNAHNRHAIYETLKECEDWLSAMIVYAVDVADLYDSMNADEVEIVNPYLYLGNPYAGDGYCQERLDGSITLLRDELTTDKGAFGYGWDEVAGVVTGAYECGIRWTDPNTDEAVTA